ncbi:hypothetical protein L2E82_11297 [Cichorium intybus]|uniref:Uncharacterized protein n=1 Tax=Cichorium intybus TaxID=13427 RepID=A0ACB9GDM8_CICIN|nr:hypothetical protein L2E82_11297 [Cichorium intybus]
MWHVPETFLSQKHLMHREENPPLDFDALFWRRVKEILLASIECGGLFLSLSVPRPEKKERGNRSSLAVGCVGKTTYDGDSEDMGGDSRR